MRTIAILPIKSFGAAKQRLSRPARRRLAAGPRAGDVLRRAGLAAARPGLDAIAVVTADPVAESVAAGAGARLLLDAEEAGQSAAASIGIRHALAAGFDRVLLVPGDTPLLDPDELTGMLERAEGAAPRWRSCPTATATGHQRAAAEPARTRSRPASARAASSATGARRAQAGVASTVEAPASLMLDVDTPEDLAELARRSTKLRRPCAADARRAAPARPRAATRRRHRRRRGAAG